MTTENKSTKEIWKDVPGFEGYYQASNLGRIKRLETYSNHNYGGLMKIPERIVEGIVSNGNWRHTLSANGKKKSFSTSQIIASTFLPKPEMAKKVIHKDGDQLNNCVENIEWHVGRESRKKLRKPKPLQLPGEIWKPVKGYEGEYEVSNIGRVKSFPKIKYAPHGSFKTKTEVLKTPVGAVGYKMTSLFTKDIEHRPFSVHRLVAEAFIPNPKNKPQVNHKNGIKTDNRVENLEWCTPKENARHAHRTGLSTYKGEKHHLTKLTKDDVLKIRQIHKNTDLLHREISEMFGVTRSAVSSVLRRKTWKHV